MKMMFGRPSPAETCAKAEMAISSVIANGRRSIVASQGFASGGGSDNQPQNARQNLEDRRRVPHELTIDIKPHPRLATDGNLASLPKVNELAADVRPKENLRT